jgi:transcriptional regulator GlxA family with amidase domain
MLRPQTPPTEIGILLYPGVLLSAVHGLTEQFLVGNKLAARHPEFNRPLIRVSHWQMQPQGAIERVFDTETGPDAGTLKIVLIPPSMQEDPLSGVDVSAVSGWLTARHEDGATIGSVCAGAFLAAEAGLLNGRAATTHWSYAEKMAARYPSVTVEGDKLLIDDGDIITAGGMMAWTDLGLRLVHRLFGPTIMMELARFMLVDPPGREQRYYSSFAPKLDHGDAPILKVQHWLQKNGARDVSVKTMAGQAAMEPRTFLRRFHAATGLKPTEYCQHVRIGRAREMLEFTKQSIEQVAYAAGYEDTSAFRKVFQKLTGLTPGDYRGRFSVA